MTDAHLRRHIDEWIKYLTYSVPTRSPRTVWETLQTCVLKSSIRHAVRRVDGSRRINVSSVDVPTQSLIVYIRLTRIAFGQSQPENFVAEIDTNNDYHDNHVITCQSSTTNCTT